MKNYTLISLTEVLAYKGAFVMPIFGRNSTKTTLFVCYQLIFQQQYIKINLIRDGVTLLIAAVVAAEAAIESGNSGELLLLVGLLLVRLH